MTSEKVKSVFEMYHKFLEKTFHTLPEILPRQFDTAESQKENGELDPRQMIAHLMFMCEEAQRFVDQGRIEKAMRWLGFLQGVFWSASFFTLDDLKKHSMPEPSAQ